jgi:hypothetical protein
MCCLISAGLYLDAGLFINAISCCLAVTTCAAAQGSHAFNTQLMQQQQHMQQQQQMQPQQLLQSCHTLADVADALQAAQGYADPAVRGHLIKELKQKQYKVLCMFVAAKICTSLWYAYALCMCAHVAAICASQSLQYARLLV